MVVRETFWRHEIHFDIGKYLRVIRGDDSELDTGIVLMDVVGLIKQIDYILSYEEDVVESGLNMGLYIGVLDDLHNVMESLFDIVDHVKGCLGTCVPVEVSYFILLDAMYSELVDIGNIVIRNHGDGVREQFICLGTKQN